MIGPYVDEANKPEIVELLLLLLTALLKTT